MEDQNIETVVDVSANFLVTTNPLRIRCRLGAPTPKQALQMEN